MITGITGETITATVTGATPGRTNGQLLFSLIQPPATTIVPETAAGMTEGPVGVYQIPIVLPAAGTYLAQWRDTINAALAYEDVVVSATSNLLGRVKERIETDLTNTELTAIIAANVADVDDARGGSGGPVTIRLNGDRRKILLPRILDATQPITITETSPWSAAVPVVLAAADFAVWNGGRTLERIDAGPNPARRFAAGLVVTYTPVSDQAQADETIIKLTILDIEYAGVKQRDVGDVKTTLADHHTERQALLDAVAPRRGWAIA